MPMKNPPHPGGTVLRDCIEPLGLSITDAAEKLGVSRFTLSELVNGKRGISPEMAVRLSKVFGGSAESWLVQQAQYDLAQVDTDRIKVKRLASGVHHSGDAGARPELPLVPHRDATVHRRESLGRASLWSTTIPARRSTLRCHVE
jgi:antitoxin HigA-1